MKKPLELGNDITIEPMEIPEGVDPHEYFRTKVLEDCPECRAAMERGEPPIFSTPEVIEKLRDMLNGARPRPRWTKPPRWRSRKR